MFLQMASRGRKVFGTNEKRAPGTGKSKRDPANRCPCVTLVSYNELQRAAVPLPLSVDRPHRADIFAFLLVQRALSHTLQLSLLKAISSATYFPFLVNKHATISR